jgi:tetratricopeptide (TPR) repeat protein
MQCIVRTLNQLLTGALHVATRPWSRRDFTALGTAGLCGVLLLSGCASSGESALTADDGEPSRIAIRLADKLQLSEPLQDQQLVFHLLAGETLGADGDLEGAAVEYARAAALTQDPEILSRAARIAMQAAAWEQLDKISARWMRSQPQALEPMRYAAMAAAQQNDLDAAEELMVRLIRNSEPASQGWQAAASIIADLEDRAGADQLVERLIQRDDIGNDDDTLYGQSVVAWQHGDLSRAAELASQASAQSERLEILEWAGQLAHAAGDTDAAIGHYERALQLSPGDKSLTLAYAELLRSNDQLEQAIAVLNSMPDSTETLYTVASYRLENGQRDEAEALLQRLLAWQPDGSKDSDIPGADPGAGTIVVGEESMRRQDPVMVHAYYTAQLADQLDQRQLAIDWYQRVDSGNLQAQANLRRAYLLAETDQLDSARELLAQARNSDNEQRAVNAYVTEATLLQNNGKADTAVALMTEALERFPGSFELTYARALAAAADRDVELAEQDFRRLIREDPDNAMLLNALGYTLTDLTDRYDEAMSLLQAAMEIDDSDASTLDSMGWIHYKLGDLALAEDYLRRAWEADDNPEIGAHLGEVLWQQDKRKQAMQIWRDAAQLDADHQVLMDTLQRFEVTL